MHPPEDGRGNERHAADRQARYRWHNLRWLLWGDRDPTEARRRASVRRGAGIAPAQLRVGDGWREGTLAARSGEVVFVPLGGDGVRLTDVRDVRMLPGRKVRLFRDGGLAFPIVREVRITDAARGEVTVALRRADLQALFPDSTR